MLSWFQALMPKEQRFFDLFENHAEAIVAAAHALRKLLDGDDSLANYVREIKVQENRADDITAETLLAVRRTFITPFDRSDIRDLITAMDDTIDQMHQTAKATVLYEVKEFDPSMQRLGDIIIRAAEITQLSLPLLRSMGVNSSKLNDYSQEISLIENEADAIHDQGLKELFLRYRHEEPMSFIVGAEIYGHLEKIVDGFEDVANRVTGIVIEHV
jgi:predicted phosphate transport protein (TIGR00153 family)